MTVERLIEELDATVRLPGYSFTWSGQYEYMLRAKERLIQVVPFTLVIIRGACRPHRVTLGGNSNSLLSPSA